MSDLERRGAVLVTGASSGIGRDCALTLDRLGFRVFAGVRKEADGEALRRDASDRLRPILLDLTRPDAIARAVAEIDGEVGGEGLLGLVNNAGVVASSSLEFLPLGELRGQFEVNLFGPIALTQALLPLLRRGRGRIVYMGSISGRNYLPFTGGYCASKSALEAFTDALRMELRPWGIEVSIVEPSHVSTPFWQKSVLADEALLEAAPAEARALYGAALARVRDYAAATARHGSPVSWVTAAVVHALTARRPRTRYLVGWHAHLRAFITILPDRLRDWLIMRSIGLLGVGRS